MKRVCALLLAATCTVMGVVGPAAGPAAGMTIKSASSNGALVNDPRLTPAVELELQRLTAEKEAACGIHHGAVGGAGGGGILSLNKYGLLTHPVANFRQERTYWCGPAAARQSLSFHKTSSGSSASLPSQSTLAAKIGTTTSGSTTTGIVSALNSYDGVFGQTPHGGIYYLASDITDTPNPYESFVNRIGTMMRPIPNPTAPIILSQTYYIPRYNDTWSRHYMTLSGINDSVSPMLMRSVDPHYSSSHYGIRWEKVGSMSIDGLCRACYEADKAGTNKVMAW